MYSITTWDVTIERIVAYDSDGHVSWADYNILEIPDDGEDWVTIGKAKVEGLRMSVFLRL